MQRFNLQECKAVVFDVDGVLVDTERTFHGMLIDECARRGFICAEGMRPLLLGRSLKQIEEMLEFYAPIGVDTTELIETANRDLIDRYGREGGADLKPGALELLEFLDTRGVVKAIASSADRPWVEAVLGGLLHRFPHVITSTEEPRTKPAPYVFLRAAELLQLPPASCVVIEDSPCGLKGARRAGMLAVWVPDTVKQIRADLEREIIKADSLFEVQNLMSGWGRTHGSMIECAR